MVQHITVNCSFTKPSSHGWKCLETFKIARLQKCFRGNVQMPYACIYIFNMNLTKKMNLISLIAYECATAVVLGFYVPPTAMVILRLGLCLKSNPKDWRSTKRIHDPLFTRIEALPLCQGGF